MDLDREQAKKAIRGPGDEEDAEYNLKLDEGEKKRYQIDLEILKEQNTHREIAKSQAIGLMGVVFGDKDHAPLWIAIMAIFIGAFIWISTLYIEKVDHSMNATMAEHASKGWTLIFTALGYVFGQRVAKK